MGDSNPFADPKRIMFQASAPGMAQNPFDRPSSAQPVSNPFGDPRTIKPEFKPQETVQSLAPQSSLAAQIISQPSPFAAQDYQPMIPLESSPKPTPAKDDNKLRYEELEKKAAMLQDKERQLKAQMSNRPVNNWPPIGFCYKCFYHDINVDIPSDFRPTMKLAYYGWIAYALILFYNFITCLANFSIDASNHDSSLSFGLSFVLLGILPMLSFVTWYRGVYKAFRVDSSLSFFFFFFVYAFQILTTIIMALGIPGGATTGWINGFTAVSKSLGVGLMSIFCAILFSLLVGLQFLTLFKVHRHYRSMGASAYRARDELVTMGQANKSSVIRGLVQ